MICSIHKSYSQIALSASLLLVGACPPIFCQTSSTNSDKGATKAASQKKPVLKAIDVSTAKMDQPPAPPPNPMSKISGTPIAPPTQPFSNAQGQAQQMPPVQRAMPQQYQQQGWGQVQPGYPPQAQYAPPQQQGWGQMPQQQFPQQYQGQYQQQMPQQNWGMQQGYAPQGQYAQPQYGQQQFGGQQSWVQMPPQQFSQQYQGQYQQQMPPQGWGAQQGYAQPQYGQQQFGQQGWGQAPAQMPPQQYQQPGWGQAQPAPQAQYAPPQQQGWGQQGFALQQQYQDPQYQFGQMPNQQLANQAPIVTPTPTGFGQANSPEEQKVMHLEYLAFGSTYPEHELSDRIDHLEKEIIGKLSQAATGERLAMIEAAMEGKGAFGADQAKPTATNKSSTSASLGERGTERGTESSTKSAIGSNSDFEMVVKAIPANAKAGDYFDSVVKFPADTVARWESFPVSVHLPDQSPESWEQGLKSSMQKWGQYIPLRQVSPGESADIEVVWVNHLPPRTLGMTRLQVAHGKMQVTISLLRPTYYLPEVPERALQGAFLHGLGHGLGIFGHSKVKGDIMYATEVPMKKEAQAPTKLKVPGRLPIGGLPVGGLSLNRLPSIPIPSLTTQETIKYGSITARDINTLKKIYETPTYPHGFETPQPLEWP